MKVWFFLWFFPLIYYLVSCSCVSLCFLNQCENLLENQYENLVSFLVFVFIIYLVSCPKSQS
jgi:hypothetical protein